MKRLILTIALLALALPSVGWGGDGSNVHWVDDNGAQTTWSNCESATALSGTSACTPATANSNAAAGDTVWINDGTYTGLTWTPSNSGTSSSRITWKAVNDGAVIIDGGFVRNCLLLNGKDYHTYEGMLFKQGLNAVARITTDADYNIFKRCTFWDVKFIENTDQNSHIIDLTYNSDHNLFEDCAAGGTGRTAINIYSDSDYTTIRRFYAHMYRCTASSTQYGCGSIQVYRSDNVLLENVVFVKDPAFVDSRNSTNDPGGISFWDNGGATVTGGRVFGSIARGNNATSGNNRQGFTSVQSVVAASIVYENDVAIDCSRGFAWNSNLVTYTNVTAVTPNISGTSEVAGIEYFTYSTYCATRSDNAAAVTKNSIINGFPLGLTNCDNDCAKYNSHTHTYNDFYGNTGNVKEKDCETTTLGTGEATTDPSWDTATYGLGAYLMRPAALAGTGEGGTDMGAQILYRYVDGALTTTALWPWSMEDRIYNEKGWSVTYEDYSGHTGGFWKISDFSNIYDPFVPPNQNEVSTDTNAVAWYELENDATDSKASFDLTAVGSPTYNSSSPMQLLYDADLESTSSQYFDLANPNFALADLSVCARIKLESGVPAGSPAMSGVLLWWNMESTDLDASGGYSPGTDQTASLSGNAEINSTAGLSGTNGLDYLDDSANGQDYATIDITSEDYFNAEEGCIAVEFKIPTDRWQDGAPLLKVEGGANDVNIYLSGTDELGSNFDGVGALITTTANIAADTPYRAIFCYDTANEDRKLSVYAFDGTLKQTVTNLVTAITTNARTALMIGNNSAVANRGGFADKFVVTNTYASHDNLELWMRTSDVYDGAGSAGRMVIAGEWDEGSDDRSWCLYLDDAEKLNLDLGYASGATTATATTHASALSVGTAYVVCATLDADAGDNSTGQVKLYVRLNSDGSTVGSDITDNDVIPAGQSWTSDDAADFRIGADAASGTEQNFFDGKVDEVTIWKDVLTDAEIYDFVLGQFSGPSFQTAIVDIAGSNDITTAGTHRITATANSEWYVTSTAETNPYLEFTAAPNNTRHYLAEKSGTTIYWDASVTAFNRSAGLALAKNYVVLPTITLGSFSLVSGEYEAACQTEPTVVYFEGDPKTEGTAASLAAGEWDWVAGVLYVKDDPSGITVQASLCQVVDVAGNLVTLWLTDDGTSGGATLTIADADSITIPFLATAPLEIGTGFSEIVYDEEETPSTIYHDGTYATWTAALAAGFGPIADDNINMAPDGVTEPGPLVLTDNGTDGHPITVRGNGYPWTGDITFGDWWTVSRVVHGSTVTLGASDIHHNSLIPTGSSLVIPEGATGVAVYNDTIAGTLVVSETCVLMKNLIVVAVNAAGLGAGETATFTNSYFIQSQAVIEATGGGGAFNFPGCVFSQPIPFVSATDFHLKRSETNAINKGVNLCAGVDDPFVGCTGAGTGSWTDLDGNTVPQGPGIDIGCYEYAWFVIMPDFILGFPAIFR